MENNTNSHSEKNYATVILLSDRFDHLKYYDESKAEYLPVTQDTKIPLQATLLISDKGWLTVLLNEIEYLISGDQEDSGKSIIEFINNINQAISEPVSTEPSQRNRIY